MAPTQMPKFASTLPSLLDGLVVLASVRVSALLRGILRLDGLRGILRPEIILISLRGN